MFFPKRTDLQVNNTNNLNSSQFFNIVKLVNFKRENKAGYEVQNKQEVNKWRAITRL